MTSDKYIYTSDKLAMICRLLSQILFLPEALCHSVRRFKFPIKTISMVDLRHYHNLFFSLENK